MIDTGGYEQRRDEFERPITMAEELLRQLREQQHTTRVVPPETSMLARDIASALRKLWLNSRGLEGR